MSQISSGLESVRIKIWNRAADEPEKVVGLLNLSKVLVTSTYNFKEISINSKLLNSLEEFKFKIQGIKEAYSLLIAVI
jgi:hypothetical protein